MSSSGFAHRRSLTVNPKAKAMASRTLDFPPPLGPITAVKSVKGPTKCLP